MLIQSIRQTFKMRLSFTHSPKVTHITKGNLNPTLNDSKNHDYKHSERKEKEHIKILFENTNSSQWASCQKSTGNKSTLSSQWVHFKTDITYFDSSLNS